MEEHELELGEKPRPNYRKKSGPKPREVGKNSDYVLSFRVTESEQEQLIHEHEIASAQSKISFANFLKGKVMQTNGVRKTRKRNQNQNQSDAQLSASIMTYLGLINRHLHTLCESLAEINQKANHLEVESSETLRNSLNKQRADLDALIAKIEAWYQD
ncbi:hypothetical protein F5984_23575 [Rudanella paleaurantiibacter]|uniref:Uncharacterized protein n=1 Tax=Rudanella paleaurantiibacter TaxID=2614655 RepID=A0A7J5TTC8_9BACT|nr:hypothetical protein [Rudanella paleaurantiibacter]KAB7726893.1 hypothetical protein F5984_23575 [Rudanella paleaurantiibacter]